MKQIIEIEGKDLEILKVFVIDETISLIKTRMKYLLERKDIINEDLIAEFKENSFNENSKE